MKDKVVNKNFLERIESKDLDKWISDLDQFLKERLLTMFILFIQIELFLIKSFHQESNW